MYKLEEILDIYNRTNNFIVQTVPIIPEWKYCDVCRFYTLYTCHHKIIQSFKFC